MGMQGVPGRNSICGRWSAGPSQEMSEPHSEGGRPARLPVKGHLLCFALSSLHVHGSVITPAKPPAERQAHAYFVFEVF